MQMNQTLNQKKSKKTALVQAVDLLSKRAHSKKNLKDKLKLRGYEDVEITLAIARLTELGYLNDEELCQRQFQRYLNESKYSAKYICCKLLQKGFSNSLVKSCKSFSSDEREAAAALKNLELKFKKTVTPEPFKFMKYLYTKGFEEKAIQQAVTAFQMICNQDDVE